MNLPKRNTPSPRQLDGLVALLNAGRYAELELAARDCAQRHPDAARAWQMLGVSLLARGLLRDALPHLQRAVELAPDNASIRENLGLAYCHLGDCAQAEAAFDHAIRIAPDSFSAWVNRAHNALQAGDAAVAAECARRAVAINPTSAAAHLNLGNALAQRGEIAEAEQSYRSALQFAPGWAEAELSLGSLFELAGRTREAQACFERLTHGATGDWRAFSNLGHVHSMLGDTAAASRCYAQALRLNPQADAAHSGLLYHLLHDENADPDAVFAEHCRYGERIEAPWRTPWPRHDNDRDPERRLRIGFVSGDFRDHAVAYFMEPMLAALARRGLDLVAFSNHPLEDAVTARLKSHVGTWHSIVGSSDDRLEAMVRAEGIDILVDLAGHSDRNRLPVFARKPAPVQVTWLGYSATTGLRSIDYRFLYRGIAAPGRLDDQFTEKLVYLPYSMTFATARDAPEVGPLPAIGRGHLSFASLNRPNKIGERSIALWARVLRALPDARMLLGAMSDAQTAERLLGEFARHGVPATRLVLRPRMPMRDYLALHNEIDILLDSFPYAGGTTSNHALWMGVPTLTLAGRTLPQRIGAGIMNKVGLPEWVAESEDEYVAIAVRAAAELPRLAALRAGLRERLMHHPSLSTDKVAASVELAFRMMWRRWCAGLPPESLELPA